jgi:hypothetical protein
MIITCYLHPKNIHNFKAMEFEILKILAYNTKIKIKIN